MCISWHDSSHPKVRSLRTCRGGSDLERAEDAHSHGSTVEAGLGKCHTPKWPLTPTCYRAKPQRHPRCDNETWSGVNHGAEQRPAPLHIHRRKTTIFHTTAARRTASALGAASLLALLLAAPAAAQPDPGTGGRDFDVVTSQPQPQSVPPVTNDDAMQYLQVGAGVIAGIALAGAGATVVSRRRHQDLTVA